MLCSIICISYNHEEYCASCLESIYNQEYRDCEIIIIDDGSTDKTLHEIEKFIPISPFPIRIIKQKNTGKVSLNANRAIDKCSGQVITFCSMDDQLTPDCISQKIHHFNNAKHLFSANSCHSRMDNYGYITHPCYQNLLPEQYSSTEKLLETEYENMKSFFIQGALFRLDFIRQIGGFENEMIGDDIILITKILQYMVENGDQNFSMCDQTGFIYRLHDDNLHKNNHRQLLTIIEWKNRFFKDRPYPVKFRKWVFMYIFNHIKNKGYRSLIHHVHKDNEILYLLKSYNFIKQNHNDNCYLALDVRIKVWLRNIETNLRKLRNYVVKK